jgi:lysophospholipase L1-like esterase/sugar lactone lactonase YvrE
MTLFLLLLVLLVVSLPIYSANVSSDIPIVMTNFSKSNITQLDACLKSGGLIFDTVDASSTDGSDFFLTYKFTIPENKETLWYQLAITAGRGPGSIGQSRYSWSVDEGTLQPALRAQRIRPDGEGIIEHLQIPLQFPGGQHTLKITFSPDQRLKLMNRATEAFTKHHAEIRGLTWRQIAAPAPVKHLLLSKEFQLKSNDAVVLLGDSITEEEFYGRHFVRIIESVFPGCGIKVYNSGVSLNRTPEGVARVDKDVLPLKPQWIIIAYGVNDAMQISPEDFISNYAKMMKPLRGNGINVLCASPSGMTPNVEALGPTFFSMHATDKASAIDRSMVRSSELLKEFAGKNGALFADIHGAITRTAIPRVSLMNNQWHPNFEGGRMFAIALLRSLGMTENEIIRTGDARDLKYFRAIGKMVPAVDSYPPAIKTFDGILQGTTIFAADYADNRLVVCDGTGKVKAVLPTPHHPNALAISKGRKELYVACEGAGKLLVYSLPDLKLKETIDLTIESYPTGLALSKDEKTLWIASFFGSKIIEFDLENRKPLRNFPMPNVVNSVALAADGTLLVSMPNALAFVDTVTGKIASTADTVKFTANFLQKPDGTIYLIDAEHWQMLPVDVAARKLGKPIPAPAQTRAMAYDMTTGHLFAGDWMNNRLLEIDGGKIVNENKLLPAVMGMLVEKF